MASTKKKKKSNQNTDRESQPCLATRIRKATPLAFLSFFFPFFPLFFFLNFPSLPRQQQQQQQQQDFIFLFFHLPNIRFDSNNNSFATRPQSAKSLDCTVDQWKNGTQITLARWHSNRPSDIYSIFTQPVVSSSTEAGVVQSICFHDVDSSLDGLLFRISFCDSPNGQRRPKT